MRHWDQLHQEGSYWTGTYEVDDVDWRLCELIARIQYAMQQHFFGTLAEKYFPTQYLYSVDNLYFMS